VLKELGERSVHLHTQHVSRGKTACPVIQPQTDTITQAAPDKKPDKAPETIALSAPPLITKLIYFNYTNNRTVVVCMQGEKLASVGLMREGYQPPVGGQAEEEGSEVSQAVAHAKTDPRLKDYVEELKQLEAHAILMEPARGLIFNEDGHGHRVLWVTFSKPKSGEPEFWAIVDMTIPKVVDAGKETQK
jgi:hypothetical protein